MINKKIIIETLIDKLKEITNKNILFEDNNIINDFKTDINDVLSFINDVLKHNNTNLSKKINSQNKEIFLSGEIDFNEYKYIVDKLFINDFKKFDTKEINNKLYDSYIDQNMFIVTLQKSKA